MRMTSVVILVSFILCSLFLTESFAEKRKKAVSLPQKKGAPAEVTPGQAAPLTVVPPSTTTANQAVPAAQTNAPSTAAGKKMRKTRSSIVSMKSVIIEYEQAGWNKNPNEIESSRILVKDSKTGRVSQIELQETEPDSGKFSGAFVFNWDKGTEFKPDVYIPDPALFEREDGFRIIQAQMAAGQIASLPIVMREEDSGLQFLDVFDSQSAADAAELAETEKKIQKASTTAKTPKLMNDKVAASQILEASELAKIELERKKAAEEAIRKENEREKLLAEERRKKEEELKKMAMMAAEELKKRKEEAKKIAAQGLALYGKSEFVKSEAKFSQASQLDPENDSFYYSYGVVLYRNKKYNKSMTILEIAKVDETQRSERDFYIALCLYRMKDYEKAESKFNVIRAAKDKAYGASSAFYIGLLKFELLQYEKAKPFFEEVLDTSTDPKLDEQAENYIEQINRILEFARLKSKKFNLSLSFGGQYDSNILLISDSVLDAARPSEVGDVRTAAGAGLQYRPLFEKNLEWAMKVRFDNIRTLKAAFVQADPSILNASAPFTYKGTLIGKGYRLLATPAYEKLWLDVNADGTPENFINSILFDINNSFVMNENWFFSPIIKIRSDTGVTDATVNATRLSLNLNNIWFFNKKKSQGLMSDVGYINNNSEGALFKFSRIDLSAIYLAPFILDTNSTIGLSMFSATYPSHPSSRQDFNVTIISGVSRPIATWLNLGINASYIINNSNVALNKYNKYVVGVNFSSDFNF
ncbi:MAG: hypothetical protein K2X47_20525 [Bdellovibrionales bacterium]|nr:hypothetical protein [Bdellovibrionales bacterium]